MKVWVVVCKLDDFQVFEEEDHRSGCIFGVYESQELAGRVAKSLIDNGPVSCVKIECHELKKGQETSAC